MVVLIKAVRLVISRGADGGSLCAAAVRTPVHLISNASVAIKSGGKFHF